MKFALLLCLLAPLAQAAEPFADPFTAEPVKERRASRGPWQIADGVARCVQDDELYKKFADHGPILFYDLEYTDAHISFDFRPEAGTKAFVFTLNNADGHVFRFGTSAKNTVLRAFPPSDDHKSISLGEPGPALAIDQWTPVKVSVTGTKVTVSIGESYTQTIDHPSFAAAKTNLSLGFSFGAVSFRNLTVTRP